MVQRTSVKKTAAVAKELRRRREVGRAAGQAGSKPDRRAHGKPRGPVVDPGPEPGTDEPDPIFDDGGPNVSRAVSGPGRVDADNCRAWQLPSVATEEIWPPGPEYVGVMLFDSTRARVVVCDGLRWRTIPLSVT